MPRLSHVALAALTLAAPPRANAQAHLPPFVEMRVPKAPTVAHGNGAPFLVHELHVTNFQATELTLARVEVVIEDGDGRLLLALEDSALWRVLARPGVSPTPPLAERARVGGGLRAVVFLWVPLEAQVPPASVRHRLTISQGTGDSVRTHVLEGAVANVTRDIAAIGPPLRGDGWLTGNGPDPHTGHRRALIPVGGTAAIGQRFAIDFVKMDERGRRFDGDSLRNESYYARESTRWQSRMASWPRSRMAFRRTSRESPRVPSRSRSRRSAATS